MTHGVCQLMSFPLHGSQVIQKKAPFGGGGRRSVMRMKSGGVKL